MSDLRDYNSSQWWCKELEGIWNAELGSTITHDMKRAAKVAINMVKEVEALHLKNLESIAAKKWAEAFDELIHQSLPGLEYFWPEKKREYEQQILKLNADRLVEKDPEAWREECRKKQAAGVKYECQNHGTMWTKGNWTFTGPKEIYREEVPQEPHAAERALWKAQRDAGTNEAWQWKYLDSWRGIEGEPRWSPGTEYRVKPMKLTARIRRRGMNKTTQEWRFTGTREEYLAECEKYGYSVASEIKEVKPKTVTCYVVAIKASNTGGKEDVKNFLDKHCITIIGDIEEMEVEA